MSPPRSCRDNPAEARKFQALQCEAGGAGFLSRWPLQHEVVQRPFILPRDVLAADVEGGRRGENAVDLRLSGAAVPVPGPPFALQQAHGKIRPLRPGRDWEPVAQTSRGADDDHVIVKQADLRS